jgi:hypothetical protein
MEAPQLTTENGVAADRWLYRRMRDLEADYHRAITAPEAILVLKVDPEIAASRRPNECHETLRARSREVWQFDWQSTDAHVMDASRPLPEVVAQAAWHAWNAI